MYIVELNNQGKWTIERQVRELTFAKGIGQALAVRYNCDYWIREVKYNVQCLINQQWITMMQLDNKTKALQSANAIKAQRHVVRVIEEVHEVGA